MYFYQKKFLTYLLLTIDFSICNNLLSNLQVTKNVKLLMALTKIRHVFFLFITWKDGTTIAH